MVGPQVFHVPELKCVAYEGAQDNWLQLCHLAKCPEENTGSLGKGVFPSLGFMSDVFSLHCVPKAFH